MSKFPSYLGKIAGLIILSVCIFLLVYEMFCVKECGYGLMILNLPFFFISQFLKQYSYPFFLLMLPTTLLFYIWIAYNIGAYIERLTGSVSKKRKKKK